MIRTDPKQTEFVDFYLPFNGRLKASNRWVQRAAMVPWDEVEACYAESFAGTGQGAPAKSGRIAYGALLIKEQLGITDEETVEQILENPYLQYFLGLRELLEKPLFDPSMMVHFRSRFSAEHHQRINARIMAKLAHTRKASSTWASSCSTSTSGSPSFFGSNTVVVARLWAIIRLSELDAVDSKPLLCALRHRLLT